MARGHVGMPVLAGAGAVVIVLGVAVALKTSVPPHPGSLHYQAYCAECHSLDGVVAILERSHHKMGRVLETAHVKRYAADPDERAQLITYLRQQADG